MSVVLKLFHVKDPQNDMYLATDPHLNYFVPGTLQKQNLSYKCSLKKYIYSKICTHFHDFKNSRSTSSQ